MKKYEAIAKACEMVERTGQSGYIYNFETKVAFFIEDGTRSIALIDGITLYRISEIIEGILNRHLNSQGWEVKLADYKDFTIEKMPWNKKIPLEVFLKVGDIVEFYDNSRALIVCLRVGELRLRALTSGKTFFVYPDQDSLKNIKVLVTCDGREIPEHLKG